MFGRSNRLLFVLDPVYTDPYGFLLLYTLSNVRRRQSYDDSFSLIVRDARAKRLDRCGVNSLHACFLDTDSMNDNPPYKHLLDNGRENVMTIADGENQSSASTANILADPNIPPAGIEANQVDELRTGFNRR